MKRRDFLKTSLAAAVSLGGGNIFKFLRQIKAGPDSENKNMPLRQLGKTGHKVSIFSLGGESAVENRRNRKKAVDLINRAIDGGVNYIDTAPSYGAGGSEENIGQVMKSRRGEVFLATKTHMRTYDGTMRLLEQSLNRLNTDFLDLYQLHNVRTDEDLERIFSPGGALEALVKLKDEGVIKNTGITGHRSPEVLLNGIEKYDFDCILLTLNAADIHYKPFQKDLLLRALEKDMGIIAMKITARGRIFTPGGLTSMEEALGYTLSFPVSTAIVGISNKEQLEENLKIVRSFKPLSEAVLKEIESKTEPYKREGNFFKYYW